ncbi:HEAT repeat domain-containing protein [Gordonia sp. X0973]|uniref:HEAT repeat domain-containing protein n=1 Tax=Gordonia sp. X0973 TaxID=2742602 RepID=UPI000F532EF6|nr:HEAT repeat domain-containing protein [Gordonia sp. X0973]QKT06007.1 HEAT repeat domain-containing protein [Gordonia sp. X0973]
MDHNEMMARDLHAVGIPEDRLWELVNAPHGYREQVPVMVDWLQHLDERVPEGPAREAVREGCLRVLSTSLSKGNREAFEIVAHQFAIEPRLARKVLFPAGIALVCIAERKDFPRIVEILDASPDGVGCSELVRFLGRYKTAEGREAAIAQLAKPEVRMDAIRALRQQRAPGVRDLVAQYLDDPNLTTRQQAARALEVLPE